MYLPTFGPSYNSCLQTYCCIAWAHEYYIHLTFVPTNTTVEKIIKLVMQHLKCRIYVGCREAVQTVLLGAIKALQLERFKDGWYLHTFLRE